MKITPGSTYPKIPVQIKVHVAKSSKGEGREKICRGTDERKCRLRYKTKGIKKPGKKNVPPVVDLEEKDEYVEFFMMSN